MAIVDSVLTLMTTNKVARSFCGWGGNAVAMANAAEAPQMATEPPDKKPKKVLKPIHLAITMPSTMVQVTA